MIHDPARPVNRYGQISLYELRRLAEQAAAGNQQYAGGGYSYHSPLGHVIAAPATPRAADPVFDNVTTNASLAVADAWASLAGLQLTVPAGGLYLASASVYLDAKLSGGSSAQVHLRVVADSPTGFPGVETVVTVPAVGGDSWVQTVAVGPCLLTGTAGQTLGLQAYKAAASWDHCNAGGDGASFGSLGSQLFFFRVL
jgi:hypothetical protein